MHKATHDYVIPLGAIGDRALITVEEAARVLNLGRTAAYEAARRGEFPTRHLGRRVVVPVPALIRWLAGDAA